MTNEQAIKLLQHCGAEAHCRHFISTHNCDGCNMMTAINMAIEALSEPKTGRDCTDFVRWLMDEVMDEENWQMNAVAYGEIICRKLKKLGLLDVVDGYYVETQKTGAWIPVGERLPSESGWYFVTVQGMERVSDMVWYYHESHEWNGVSETQKVLAWMPLPEQYKGGDEE